MYEMLISDPYNTIALIMFCAVGMSMIIALVYLLCRGMVDSYNTTLDDSENHRKGKDTHE